MIIVEKNEGKKIKYTVEDTKIILDDKVSYNLAKYQQDQESVIDICLDEDMQLTSGLKQWYVANIIIPPKNYEMIEAGKDEKGDTKYERVAKPFNMDEVTLILWTLPTNYNYFNGGAY